MVTTTNTNITIIIITLTYSIQTGIYKVKVGKRNKLLKPISTMFT